MSATIDGQTAERPRVPHDAPVAISIHGLSKTFKFSRENYHTFKERALHMFSKRQQTVLRAVNDVNLEVRQGEFFGIVGRNGSGKSTMLKCVAGIYNADVGEIEIRGRLSPFIELGVGFNPQLAARDNVMINAIMLGLSRREAEARFDHIIEFAELEGFTDLALKNYSSGMQVRLAFSVAVQVDAEVLLMDEVLAVGDASFQRKCFDEFIKLRGQGTTIVLVTHDMGAIQKFCDRAMLLEQGNVVDIGDPESIARQYNDLNFKRASSSVIHEPLDPVIGASEAHAPVRPRAARLLSARFESADGEPLVTVEQGEPCRVRLQTEFNEPLEDPVFAVSLKNEFGVTAFGANTQLAHGTTGSFTRGERVAAILSFENRLAPGRYSVTASVGRSGPVGEVFDLREDLCSVIVYAGETGGGLVDLPHTFELERES